MSPCGRSCDPALGSAPRWCHGAGSEWSRPYNDRCSGFGTGPEFTRVLTIPLASLANQAALGVGPSLFLHFLALIRAKFGQLGHPLLVNETGRGLLGLKVRKWKNCSKKLGKAKSGQYLYSVINDLHRMWRSRVWGHPRLLLLLLLLGVCAFPDEIGDFALGPHQVDAHLVQIPLRQLHQCLHSSVSIGLQWVAPPPVLS